MMMMTLVMALSEQKNKATKKPLKFGLIYFGDSSRTIFN